MEARSSRIDKLEIQNGKRRICPVESPITFSYVILQ
jgi:hypothetical protein